LPKQTTNRPEEQITFPQPSARTVSLTQMPNFSPRIEKQALISKISGENE